MVPIKNEAMKTKWTEIVGNLRNSLESGAFRVWVAPLEAEISAQGLDLIVPNPFMGKWIGEHLLKEIRQAAAPVLGLAAEQIKITFRVGKQQKPKAASAILANVMPVPSQASLPIPSGTPQAASGVWRYRFEDFVTGSSNSLAVAAARDLCQSGQVRTLFVTSASGLGKTHLTQAAGQLLNQSRQPLRVGYLTAERFASRFVAAMRAKDLETFKQSLCNLDVLLLEDVHFLQKKNAMQEFVLAIIKNLQAKGGRVIFTSSFSPRQMQDMDSQLASHFCSGILASMEKPDLEMRKEILQRKAEKFQICLPEEISTLLSQRLSSDVRQLESCLKSMIFKARLLNSGLTVDLALETMEQYSGAEMTLDLPAIVRLVCESFGLTEAQLKSRSRKQEYVQGRNTVFYLARKHTDLSLEHIGGALNRRHSTVTRSITQVERELAMETREGRQLAKTVALIEKRCGVANNQKF